MMVAPALEAPPRRTNAAASKPLKAQIATWMAQTVPFVVALVLWTLLAGRIQDVQVLPSPARVVTAGREMLARGSLWSAAQESLATLALGALICIAITVPIGATLALSVKTAKLVMPMVKFFSNVPAMALIPLFIIWFGFSRNTVYATLLYTAALPLFFATFTGVQKIPRVYASGLKTMGASSVRILRDVFIPGALPGIAVGIRLALAYGWRAVVAGELIVGTGGLGLLLSRSRVANQVDQIVATMVCIAVLFIVIDRLLIFPWEEKITSRWTSL